jgi:predicted small secreted protein
MKRAIALVVMVVATIGAATGSAAAVAAASGETGACNMMQGEPGMATAMTSISDQGHAGMMGAHVASGCSMG